MEVVGAALEEDFSDFCEGTRMAGVAMPRSLSGSGAEWYAGGSFLKGEGIPIPNSDLLETI